MKILIIAAILIILSILAESTAMADCVTNTIMSGGRMIICTTCCMGGFCNTTCM